MENNFGTNDNNELCDKENAWRVQQGVSSSPGYPTIYVCGQWSGMMPTNPLQPEDTMGTPDIFASRVIPGSGPFGMNTTGPTADNIRNNRFVHMPTGTYAPSKSPNTVDNHNNALVESGTGEYRNARDYGYPNPPEMSNVASMPHGSHWEGYGLPIYQEIPIVPSADQDPDLIPTGRENDRAVRSSPSPRSRSRSEVNIVCEICHTSLTGVHATGNLARHQKSLKCASSSKRKEWRCNQCDKVYQRSDGLRKHTRGKHGTSGSVV